MEDFSAESRIEDQKSAAFPPIMIHSANGTPASGISSATNQYCNLPQISPQTSVLNGGQSPYQNYNAVKNEFTTSYPQTSSCMYYSNNSLPQIHLPTSPKQPPNSINLQLPNQATTTSSSSTNVQHLQLPPNVYMQVSNESPPFSDIGAAHPLLRGKIKSEIRGIPHRLPSLSGYISGSNPDLEEIVSPLIPSLNSLSPYIGSGISEIPSFPSILTSPSAQISRKRALSSSPLSDMFDVSTFRSSPNSLMAAIYNNASNPMTPSGPLPAVSNGATGHFSSQPNSSLQAAMQYKIQQRKTSIEHNQNVDGTTNTTITNQITFSEHPNSHDPTSDTQSDLPLQGSMNAEPMEFNSYDENGATSDFPHLNREEDPIDPHVCMWEECGLNFDDLEDLVQHIENAHIEKGKMDDYTCLWHSCIRAQKPFNARYKLLIHMRIHSGEKPNKCTVSNIYKHLTDLHNNSGACIIQLESTWKLLKPFHDRYT